MLLEKPDSTTATIAISPTALSYNLTLTPGDYTVGSSLVFSLMVENAIDQSPYSEKLEVDLGVVPNAPTNFKVRRYTSGSSVIVEW